MKQRPLILLCLTLVGLVLALDWSLSNMAVLIVFGIPAATLLTPIFRDKGWLVAGWWR